MSSRKEKRRSSFFNGRKSKSLFGSLPISMPAGLNEEEKRAYICVEKCFHRLQEEFTDLDELQQFTVRAREGVTQELYNQRANAAVPNVRVNPAMEQMIDLLPKYIGKLEKEEQDWNELLHKHTESADEAERTAESLQDEMDITELPASCLSTKQREFLDNKPDYSSILDNLNHLHSESMMMNAETEQSISMLKQYAADERLQLRQRSYALHKSVMADLDATASSSALLHL